MIKLFVCDLDGTLLNRYHMTDKMIIKTIDQVMKSDCYFAIATGRNMRYKQYQSLFKNRKIYNICMNGALIYDTNQNIIYQKYIDKDIVENILKSFPDIHFEFITSTHTYIRFPKDKHINNFQKMNIWTWFVRKPMMTLFLKDCLFNQTNEDILQHDILKINCRIPDKKQREIFDYYLSQHQDQIVNAPFSSGLYEITDQEVNKGQAVKRLASLLNIKDEEIAVYGDGGNDIAMLEMFKYSYAPYNASREVKKVAHNIIGHNHFHSVARHIRITLKKQR